MLMRFAQVWNVLVCGAVCVTACSAAAQSAETRRSMKVERLLGEERERVYTAREERWTFPGLPKATGWETTEVQRGARTIRVGDFVDDSWVRDSAIGLRVAAQSMGGFRVTDVPLTRDAGLDLAALEASVVPPEMEDWDRPLLSNLKVRVHERFDLQTEKRLTRIAVPDGGRLVFGFGLLDDLSRAVLTNDPAWDGYHARRAVPVRFEVHAETEAGPQLLFREVYPPMEERAGKYAWQDRSVDLAAYAGQSIDLRFTTSVDEAQDDHEAMEWFPVWSEPALYSPQDAEPRPNVILISLDTLRADHLGTYGYGRDTSPHLDRFAKEAYVFERCMAPSSWTVPSHVSLFTGLPPSVHMAGMWQGWRLRPEFTTLAESALEAGYVTAAYTDGGAVEASFGLNQGFDRYSDGRKAHVTFRTADDTFANGRAFVEHQGDAPFFLFLHTYQIHAPYRPPGEHRFAFTKDQANDGLPKKEMTDRKIRRTLIDLYDGEIRFTDHVLGEFLNALRESGRLDDTVVIIFSDHGEEFWEHGGVAHGLTLYQEQLHVPLIVSLPGGGAGRISDLVGLIDVYATVAEFLGIGEAPPKTSHSLAALMQGISGEFSRETVASELMAHRDELYLMSVQSEAEKYILTTKYEEADSVLRGLKGTPPSLRQVSAPADLLAGAAADARPSWREQWYDLTRDPDESHAAKPNTAARSRAFNWLIQEAADYATMPPPDLFKNATNAELTPEEIEEMRALGYVE